MRMYSIFKLGVIGAAGVLVATNIAAQAGAPSLAGQSTQQPTEIAGLPTAVADRLVRQDDERRALIQAAAARENDQAGAGYAVLDNQAKRRASLI